MSDDTALVPFNPNHHRARKRTFAPMPALQLVVAKPDEALDSLARRFLGWFKFVRQRKENTILAYGRDLASFLAFCRAAGLTRADAIRFQHVELYFAQLQHLHGCSAQTVNRHRFSLREFFRWCRREGVIMGNPAEDTYPLRAPRRLPKCIPITDQRAALDRLRRDRTPTGLRDYGIVATGLYTGLRVQELCDLRLDQVDLDAGKLRVVAKGSRERELPVVPKLATILRRYLVRGRPHLVGCRGSLRRDRGSVNWHARWYDETGARRHRSTGTTSRTEAERLLREWAPPPPDGGYLFVQSGDNRRRRDAGAPLLTRSIFWMLRDRLGDLVPGIHPHLLRHSFASRLRENGGDIALVKEAMGHASITTTMIYAHLTTKKRTATLARLLK